MDDHFMNRSYRDANWKAGIAAGILGGFVWIALLMIFSFGTGLGFFFPFAAIAGVFFSSSILSGGIWMILLGASVHLFLSAILGSLFSAMLSSKTKGTKVVIMGLAFGLATWFAMTYFILPTLNPTLLTLANSLGGAWLIAHLLFGYILAITPSLRDRYFVRGLPLDSEEGKKERVA